MSRADVGVDEQGAVTCEIRVGGMDCASCAAAIERSLSSLAGVEDVHVDVVGGRVRVAYADGKLARGDLAGAIRRVGYTVLDDTAPGAARRAAFTIEGDAPAAPWSGLCASTSSNPPR